VLLCIGHRIIYTTKLFYDKIDRSHGGLLSAFGFATYSIGDPPAFSN
jgi:hypothetical protein